MRIAKLLLGLSCLLLLALISSASDNQYFVSNLALDPLNKPSLQRGAQLYFNYCSSCHSLQYERYNHLAKLIGAENAQQQIYTNLIQKSFIFDPHGDLNQVIASHLSEEDAKRWFGVVPPDLTNITIIHSPAWVYNFLRGFYRDDSRPFGANNVIAPNTAMPNILLPLRGETKIIWNNNQFDHFVTVQAGQLRPLEFDHAMYDLVNFLNLMADPKNMIRIWLGIICLAFLVILLMMIIFWQRTLINKK